MSIVKSILQILVTTFFKIYFGIFGKPKLSKVMQQTLKLYDNGSFSDFFQYIRLWDAPFEVIDKNIPGKGIVVDLGSGDGLLANMLAISRPRLSVYGVDINKDRINLANKGIDNTKFITGDITKSTIPKADVILLVHVLHHLLSRVDQENLLIECKKKLKKNGTLIIVEIAEKPILKYFFTWATDHVIVPILFEGKIFNSNIFFRTIKQWKKLFSELNLKTKVIIAQKSKPFSHVIFICNKD